MPGRAREISKAVNDVEQMRRDLAQIAAEKPAMTPDRARLAPVVETLGLGALRLAKNELRHLVRETRNKDEQAKGHYGLALVAFSEGSPADAVEAGRNLRRLGEAGRDYLALLLEEPDVPERAHPLLMSYLGLTPEDRALG
jgi:hypothetical protein